MKKSKLDWGQYLRPTKEAVKNLGLDPADFGIGFGKTRDGLLRVIRDGQHSVNSYHSSFWELLPE